MAGRIQVAVRALAAILAGALLIALVPLGTGAARGLGPMAPVDLPPIDDAVEVGDESDALSSASVEEERQRVALDDDVLHGQPLVCPAPHRIAWQHALPLHERSGRV